MANSSAVLTRKLTDTTLPTPPTVTVNVPYQAAQPGGRIDVPAATIADTVYPVAFGSCAEATYAEIQNDTGQDIAARIGGQYVDVVLVAGTVTQAFAVATGERLSYVLLDDNGGTPGIISVRRSAGNVIVESWVVAVGLQVADVSTIRVYNNAPPLLPDGAILMLAAAALGSGVASAEVILTAPQVGEGIINTIVLGDPI